MVGVPIVLPRDATGMLGIEASGIRLKSPRHPCPVRSLCVYEPAGKNTSTAASCSVAVVKSACGDVQTESFLRGVKGALAKDRFEMPTVQQHEGVYKHDLGTVSSFLWDRFEGHGWIRDVEVIRRNIDEQGRLHSRRLLTLHSPTPLILRPLLGSA